MVQLTVDNYAYRHS